MILDQLIYTVKDGSWEASYLTPIADATGVVQRYERASRNFSDVQKAEFLAQLNSVAGAQMLAANDARVLAEANFAAEQSAHAADVDRLNATLADEQAAHAATTKDLNAALARLDTALAVDAGAV